VAECEWAVFCDYAFLDAQGKMCLVGIFNNFNVRTVPIIHPQAALVVQIKGEPNERWRARINLLRPNGSLLHKFEQEGVVSEDGGAGILLRFQPLQLPDRGTYRCTVLLNDSLSYETAFTVRTPTSDAPS
jgi:hypothetical protein